MLLISEYKFVWDNGTNVPLYFQPPIATNSSKNIIAINKDANKKYSGGVDALITPKSTVKLSGLPPLYWKWNVTYSIRKTRYSFCWRRRRAGLGSFRNV